jgi:hypothetical protein
MPIIWLTVAKIMLLQLFTLFFNKNVISKTKLFIQSLWMTKVLMSGQDALTAYRVVLVKNTHRYDCLYLWYCKRAATDLTKGRKYLGGNILSLAVEK